MNEVVADANINRLKNRSKSNIEKTTYRIQITSLFIYYEPKIAKFVTKHSSTVTNRRHIHGVGAKMAATQAASHTPNAALQAAGNRN